MSKRHGLIALALAGSLVGGIPAAGAAENMVLVTGAFRRSIPIADFEYLATTGRARGLLGDLLALSRQNPTQVSKLLNESISLPVVLVSRLINTRIGDAILQRVARIVYPLKAPEAGIPALRAALVMSLVEDKNAISAISFLKAYPNSDMEVNIPALLNLLNKASSITQLVRFFSESPLDGLRGSGGGAGDAATSPAPAVAPTIKP